MKKEDLELGRTYLNTVEIVSDVIKKMSDGERLTIVCGNKSISFNTRDTEKEIKDANNRAVIKTMGILEEYRDKFEHLFKEL